MGIKPIIDHVKWMGEQTIKLGQECAQEWRTKTKPSILKTIGIHRPRTIPAPESREKTFDEMWAELGSTPKKLRITVDEVRVKKEIGQ